MVRIGLEPEDVQAIAKAVLEEIRPLVASNGKHHEEDIIFDVPGLAEYLCVTPKWIYEQTSYKSIPHYKLTNKQLRFKKKDIDLWLEKVKKPAVCTPTGKMKLVNSR